MTAIRTMRTVLAIFLIVVSMSACANSSPEAGATPTVEAATPTENPTETPIPTSTLQPTEVTPTVATQPASGVDGATAVGTETPAAGASGANQPAVPAAPASKAPEKYQYLGQTIADRTQLRPNVPVTITWTVKNAGDIGWSTDYTLRYFSGPKATKDTYNFTKEVGAGKTIDLTVTFTTPADPGEYDIWFKLVNPQGQNFGDVDFVFTVTSNPTAFTSTPTQ